MEIPSMMGKEQSYGRKEIFKMVQQNRIWNR